jgi:hypothetical protein
MHATAFESRAPCSVILVNAEAEQRLLGAILIDNKSFHRVSGLIRADHFSNGLHARIFEGVAHLIATGTAANPVTLKNLFDQDDALRDVGGARYLAQLAAAAAQLTAPQDYAQIVVDLAQRRWLASILEETLAETRAFDIGRDIGDVLAQHEGRLSEIRRGAPGKAWPEPTDILGAEAAPSFPIDFLPGALADFALDQAVIMQAPVDFIAVPLLIAGGTVIGKDFLMAPKALATWTERPCLWGGCIADVGSNKTAGFNAAFSAIWRLQAEFREGHRGTMKAHQAKARIAKAMIKKWEKTSVAALEKGEDPPEAPPEIPETPTVREIVANDATQERLVEMMQQNPRGIMLYRDELSGWFYSFNQYRPGSDEQFFLQCHAGGPWAHHRKAGDLFVPDLFLSIFGGFQPDVIAQVLSNRSRPDQRKAPDNGMAARFSLLVWPEPIKGFQYVDKRRDHAAAAKVEKLFFDMSALDPERFVGVLPEGSTHYDPFRFTPEGQAVFREWYLDHHAELGAMEPGDPLKGHYHKYDGLFARLSLVHHLIRYVLDEPVEPTRVDHHTASAVRDFIDNYLRCHARKIYRHLGRGTAYHGAKKIGRWLAADRTITSFTARDVGRKEWGGLTEPDHVDAALNYLENVAGWVRGEEIAPGPRGGRTTKSYPLNPKVRSAVHNGIDR